MKFGGRNVLHTPSHTREGEIREMQPRVSGLLPEISLLVGRSGEGDSGGGVTCRRWVIGVVSLEMQVFLMIFPKNLPFFEQIQPLGSDTM